MKIRYFFRKTLPDYHSIEELFDTIISHLPVDIEKSRYQLPFLSKGVFKRILNTFAVIWNQKGINHITGDVHYISLLMRKSKTILTIHDVEVVKRKKGLKKALLVSFWFYLPALRVQYITVISEFTKEELLEIIPVKPEKIVVVPDCVNIPITTNHKPFNSQSPTLLTIGTKPNKNLERLIVALDGIPCKLTILGRLTNPQIELLNKHHVAFSNFYDLPYDQVIELYHQADLLSFISIYEGFGMPVLEAQAVGIPVLASTAASIPDVAGNGALFVNPYSVYSIRAGIIDIIYNHKVRDSLVLNGRVNAERFAISKVVSQYINVYEKMLNEL